MIQNCLTNTTFDGPYLLQLGNAQGWQLVPTEGVRLEVDELARLMGLKSCEPNGYPKLIFIRSGSDGWQYENTKTDLERNVGEVFIGDGWKSHDLVVLRVWSHDNRPDIICEVKTEMGGSELDMLSVRLSLHAIYQRALEAGGLTFHAGLVERDGKGILLAALGDTGKSTCCRRFPLPWNALCDEEALVLSDDTQHYIAHPFPTWSDYFRKRSKRTWDVQRHIPVSAVFFLEQAEEDDVIPLGKGEAAVFAQQSAMQVCHRYWNNLDHEELKTLKKTLFHNGCEFSKAIQAFRLRVSLTGRFWEKVDEVLP
ncbi:MAG: SynChlorMet cassette protein ScmC [Syntrophobacterales bacterium]|jgi:SynChlorMet cassette protein ScmC